MEILRQSDINFRGLKRLKCYGGSESRLFYDEDTIYKMYKTLSHKELNRKKTKIELLADGGILEDTVMPKEEILRKNILTGFTMERIKNSLPLFDFTTRSNNLHDFIQLVRRVSLSLRKIHDDPRNIVVGDLSFCNIIFDNNFKHYFVDFDSCMIDGIPSDRICFLFDNYIKRRSIYEINIDENTDRLSLILCTLYTIFLKQVDDISMYEFDLVSEKLEALKNMREFVVEMKKYEDVVPSVPYMDEVILAPSKKRIKAIVQNK